MSEDFKYQLSLKLGPNNLDMLNIRASEWNEFGQALDNALFGVDKINQTIAALHASATLGAEVISVVDSAAAQPQPAAVQPAQPASGDPTTTCQHGQRKLVEGVSAKGPWAAWFCPAAKGDPTQCKPQWVSK